MTRATTFVTWISYEESKVFVNVTKDAILEAPQYYVSPLGEAYGDTRNFD